MDAFAKGEDIHRHIAAGVFKKDPSDVTDLERRFSKTATFAILYGKSVFNFAKEFMGGDLKSAQKLFDSLFEQFPGIKTFIDEAHKNVKKDFLTRTIWGDPIRIDFDPNDKIAVSAAERYAQNYPVQSSSSNMAAVCIKRVSDTIRKLGMLARTYGFTHDSADLDVPGSELIRVCYVIPLLAEKFPLDMWKIPAKVDLEVGINGADMLKLKQVKDHASYVTKSNNEFILQCDFEGKTGVIEKVVDRIKPYAQVDFEVHEKKESWTSTKELFMPKRAFSTEIGSVYDLEKGTLTAVQRIQ